jgi:hypothetical protein
MLEIKKIRSGPRFELVRRQRGAVAVEFAMLAIIFFTIVFSVLELTRALYLFNTLQEVTRRAAAMAVNSHFDGTTVSNIQKAALFADAKGNLILGEPVTPAHLKIEYLSVSRDATTGALALQSASPMPSCSAKNKLNCLTDPYSSSCIRFVRVRVCQPGGTADCAPVPYKMLFPLIDLSVLTLPRSTTIAPAQTLGFTFGSIPCP